MVHSLKLVQEFYGSSATDVARAATGTPAVQLRELADRLLANSERTPTLFGKLRSSPAARPSTVASDAIARGWNGTNASLEDIRLKHMLLYCERIAIPDRLLSWAHGVTVDLEGLALDESELDQHWGPQFRAALQQMAPLESLLDAGLVNLVPPFDVLGMDTGAPRGRQVRSANSAFDLNEGAWVDPWSDPHTDAHDDVEARVLDLAYKASKRGELAAPAEDFSYVLDDETLRYYLNVEAGPGWHQEPALVALLAQRCAQALGGELTFLELDPHDPQDWSDIVAEGLDYVGEGARDRDLVTPTLQFLAGKGAVGESDALRLLEFYVFTQHSDYVPVYFDKGTRSLREYLDRQAMKVLSGSPPPAAQRAGLDYLVPSLVNHSLADLVRLRQQEDVFQEVRTALRQLEDACAERATVSSRDEYERLVRDVAAEAIGPAQRKLAKQVRQEKLARFVTAGGIAGGLRLVFASAWKATGLPGSGAVGGAASWAGDKAIGRFRRERSKALELGNDLLVQMLDEPRPVF